MTKVAIIELGTNQIKLSIVGIEQEKSFEIQEEYSEYVGIDKHIEDGGLIKTVKIKECISILEMYKEIALSRKVDKFNCVVSANLTKAKNYLSFIEEANAALDLKFNMLSEEEEINTLYTAIVNTLDIAKGVIISVSTSSTRIIYYCRRIILHSIAIPMGYANFTNKESFIKELEKHSEDIKSIDTQVPVIGASEIFTGFARLLKKKERYPIDIEHNYNTDKENFDKISAFLKELKVEKEAKLKGITENGVGFLIDGMDVVQVIMEFIGLNNIVISKSNRNIGLAYKLTMGAEEKPVSDVFTHSLDNIMWASGIDVERAKSHYNLASILHSQLKVLHKLPRAYSKVLKAATLLYTLGSNINKLSYHKVSYYAILNSNLFGLSHKEIVMVAFVAGCRNWDDFTLSEWVKYKGIMTDEDLDAVRKMSLVAAMADIVNLRMENIVKDISCDILGDSVIIKLVTDVDLKKNNINIDAAKTEIFCTRKFAKEFAKIFKKNVEIL